MPAYLLEKINYFLSQQLPPAPCAYTEILETPPQQQNSCGSCVDVFARRLGEGTFDFVLGVNILEIVFCLMSYTHQICMK
jgi:hypothetical protein